MAMVKAVSVSVLFCVDFYSGLAGMGYWVGGKVNVWNAMEISGGGVGVGRLQGKNYVRASDDQSV